MQAAELFEQEIKPPEFARCLRVSRKPAYQWHQLWRGRGSGLSRRERLAVPAVPALSGEAGRIPR